MTKVEECTNAETGVGAAIAAGSQAEKGIWALLVHAEITIITNNTHDSLADVLVKVKNVQLPYINIIEIEINKPTSPRRLVRAVIMPALYDLFLW